MSRCLFCEGLSTGICERIIDGDGDRTSEEEFIGHSAHSRLILLNCCFRNFGCITITPKTNTDICNTSASPAYCLFLPLLAFPSNMYTKDICRDKPPKVSSKANVM
jgi:hypothetical protein